MVATTIAKHGSRIDNVRLKVTKGNQLTDIVLEAWDGEQFAKGVYEAHYDGTTASTSSTVGFEQHGMAFGKEAARAVRVSKQVAALGARGDFIEFILDITALGTDSYAKALGNFMVQMLDYTGVPVAVQHAIFGKYSPFVTPTQPISRGMLAGIDRQVVEAVHNVVCTAASTATSQKIRGTADARVVMTPNAADGSVTQMVMKLKPGTDGCFVIPAGAVLWAGLGTASDLVASIA